MVGNRNHGIIGVAAFVCVFAGSVGLPPNDGRVIS